MLCFLPLIIFAVEVAVVNHQGHSFLCKRGYKCSAPLLFLFLFHSSSNSKLPFSSFFLSLSLNFKGWVSILSEFSSVGGSVFAEETASRGKTKVGALNSSSNSAKSMWKVK